MREPSTKFEVPPETLQKQRPCGIDSMNPLAGGAAQCAGAASTPVLFHWRLHRLLSARRARVDWANTLLQLSSTIAFRCSRGAPTLPPPQKCVQPGRFA
jgi:hypothetical protein